MQGMGEKREGDMSQEQKVPSGGKKHATGPSVCFIRIVWTLSPEASEKAIAFRFHGRPSRHKGREGAAGSRKRPQLEPIMLGDFIVFEGHPLIGVIGADEPETKEPSKEAKRA